MIGFSSTRMVNGSPRRWYAGIPFGQHPLTSWPVRVMVQQPWGRGGTSLIKGGKGIVIISYLHPIPLRRMG